MSQKKLRVLYVPGLGDSRLGAQQLTLFLWRLWDVRAEIVPMHWDTTEAWEAKLERLLTAIDTLEAQGYTVGLVGVSAGASAVINAYALRKAHLVGCVLVAGKVNRPEAIGTHYRQHNPALVTSVEMCVQSLAQLDGADRQRILSRYAVRDLVVAQADSIIPGACNRQAWTIGHAVTIGFQLVFGAPGFLRFLKRMAKRHVVGRAA